MKSTFAKWNLWAWDLKSNLGLIATASDTCRCCLPGRGSTHTHLTQRSFTQSSCHTDKRLLYTQTPLHTKKLVCRARPSSGRSQPPKWKFAPSKLISLNFRLRSNASSYLAPMLRKIISLAYSRRACKLHCHAGYAYVFARKKINKFTISSYFFMHLMQLRFGRSRPSSARTCGYALQLALRTGRPCVILSN